MARPQNALRHEDADFSTTAQSISPRLSSTKQKAQDDERYTLIINEMVGLLWSDLQLADAFNANTKGWQIDVAKAIGIDSIQLRRAISHFGTENLEALVNRNPAGDAPIVHGRSKVIPLVASNASCQETAGPCGTGTCNSCHCQSGNCVRPGNPLIKHEI
jgi:hypothetical protein